MITSCTSLNCAQVFRDPPTFPSLLYSFATPCKSLRMHYAFLLLPQSHQLGSWSMQVSHTGLALYQYTFLDCPCLLFYRLFLTLWNASPLSVYISVLVTLLLIDTVLVHSLFPQWSCDNHECASSSHNFKFQLICEITRLCDGCIKQVCEKMLLFEGGWGTFANPGSPMWSMLWSSA